VEIIELPIGGIDHMITLSHVVDDFEVHKIDAWTIKFGKNDIYP
jgi:hypothetical protein